MNRLIQITIVLAVVAGMTGCATPYMIDRRRDAADMFTATIGTGAGVKARAGVLQVGLLANHDAAGLRGGTVGYWKWKTPELLDSVSDFDWLVVPLYSFGVECFHPATHGVAERSKGFDTEKWLPILTMPMSDVCSLSAPGQVPHYLQCELVAGVGVTIRLGFNPGELLDFVLGWTTIDIFNDDLEARKTKKQAIGIGSPIAEAPSHTTVYTDHVYGGSAARKQ